MQNLVKPTQETIVARYTFGDQAAQSAVERTADTGTAHYAREDTLTGTFVVYTVQVIDR